MFGTHYFYLFILAVMVMGCAQNHEQSPQDPPNIIFILTDDQRWDALGFAGNDLIHTPEMDRLAEQGIYFSNAMVSTPICAASRATILTGLYERSHRYDFHNIAIKDEFMERSYPMELRKDGYFTGFFGKLGVQYEMADSLFDVFESYDRNNSFKDYRGYNYKTLEGDTVHLTRYTGQKALDFIDQAIENQPFSLNLSFSAPHAHDGATEQYFWQKDFDDLLDAAEIPNPELGESFWFDRLPKEVREGFNRIRWQWRFDTPEKYQHSVKGYYRMIAGIDREIGLIRKKLNEKGIDQNTIIILMGDNGYFLGERQLAGKWLMYDHGVRVPLIIYDPRRPGSRRTNQMAMNVDIPVPILDLAGGEIPGSWQGKSLVPLLGSHNHKLERDTAFIEHLWEFEHIPPSEGLRTRDWKYFRYRNDLTMEELYDLKNDPMETRNLALEEQHLDRLQQFRMTMNKMASKYGPSVGDHPTALEVQFLSREGVDGNNKKEDLEFSWKLPESIKAQTAYQVLVAETREKLEHNVGDVWNSGEQKSNQSVSRPYLGDGLISGKVYFWKVRIWDEYHRLGNFSQIQGFETP